MQKKTDTTTLASSIAYLLLAILIINIIPFQLQEAFAQAGLTKITGFSHNLLTTGYSNNKIWALATNGTQGSTANNWIYEVNATNETIDALYNITRSTGAQAQDMWCSPEYCYVTDGNGSNQSFISRIATITAGGETKGEIIDSVNVTISSSNEAGAINGAFSSGGSFSTLFFSTLDPSVQSSRSLRIITSSPQFGTPATFESSIGPAITGNIYSMIDETGVDRRMFALVDNTSLRPYSLGGAGSDPALCSFNPILGANAKILSVVAPDGTSWTGANPELQELFITSGVSGTGGMRIVKDTSNWLNCTTDTTNYTITNTKINLGNIGTLNGMILENHGIAVVQESGVSARISIMQYDPDPEITDPTERFSNSLLIVNTNPLDSQALSGTPAVNQMNYNQDTQHIFWAETGSGRAVVMYDVSSFEPSPPPVTPTTPVLPENNIAELTGFIFCIGGFLSSTACDSETGFPIDTNPQTNGTGIAVLAFLIIVSYAFIVSIHFSAQRQLAGKNVQLVEVMTVNPVLLLVMLIVDTGIVWYFGFIEDIIFYGIIVVLLTLGGFGLYRQIKPT